jgi:hypothetical protein
VLTPFDDYPVHQTSAPIAQPASGDPNHYDRYFFCGYTADASLYFAAAMGLYPNRSVIDAAFSVVRGGEQVNVHASGRCPAERSTVVGPVRVEVVEPLRILRVLVESPEHGLRADVTFTARTLPVEEPRFHRLAGSRVVMDYTRLTQWGAWSGWIDVDGEQTVLDPTAVLGCRDRSWGIRMVGERVGGAPGAVPQFFWLWAPTNFDDVCVHFDVNEDADGRAWHECGFVVPVGDGEAVAARRVTHRIDWTPGTRRARAAEIDLELPDRSVETMRMEPLVEFQMLGIGYLHPEWSHGVWKGEQVHDGDRWTLPVPDPLALHHLHVQALCRATLGGRTGVGILEQLVIGPYHPAGMTGLLDGAPD